MSYLLKLVRKAAEPPFGDFLKHRSSGFLIATAVPAPGKAMKTALSGVRKTHGNPFCMRYSVICAWPDCGPPGRLFSSLPRLTIRSRKYVSPGKVLCRALRRQAKNSGRGMPGRQRSGGMPRRCSPMSRPAPFRTFRSGVTGAECRICRRSGRAAGMERSLLKYRHPSSAAVATHQDVFEIEKCQP